MTARDLIKEEIANLSDDVVDKVLALIQKIKTEPKVLKMLVNLDKAEDSEREAWLKVSSEALKYAYHEDEPDYPVNLIAGK